MSGTSGKTTRQQNENGSFVERSDYAQDSVEISRTAKGDVTFSVKLYGVNPTMLRRAAIAHFEALLAHFYPPEPSLAETLKASLELQRAHREDKEQDGLGATFAEQLLPKGKIRL